MVGPYLPTPAHPPPGKSSDSLHPTAPLFILQIIFHMCPHRMLPWLADVSKARAGVSVVHMGKTGAGLKETKMSKVTQPMSTNVF